MLNRFNRLQNITYDSRLERSGTRPETPSHDSFENGVEVALVSTTCLDQGFYIQGQFTNRRNPQDLHRNISIYNGVVLYYFIGWHKLNCWIWMAGLVRRRHRHDSPGEGCAKEAIILQRHFYHIIIRTPFSSMSSAWTR